MYSIANGCRSRARFFHITGPRPLVTMTSQLQIFDNMPDKSTFSQEDSLVSRTAQQASAKGKTMIVTSGPTCYDVLEKSDLAGSWAKTFSALLLGMEGWYSRRCALTLKLKVTPYSRLFFQLQPSMHRTEEIGSGLLRTPSAQEPGVMVARLVTKDGEPAKIGQRAYDKITGRLAQVGLTQQAQIMMLPTPTCMDSTNATATMKSTQVKDGSMHSVTLNRAMVMGMLPTPRTADVEGGTVKDVQTDGKGYYRTNADGVRWGVKLRDVVESGMLPTPKAQEARGNASVNRGKYNLTDEIAARYQPTGKTSQLNPRFVAEMMGFPPNWTELPFQSGEPNQSKDMGTP